MGHIVGKVYDMNQANWNKLIAELEATKAENTKLRAALEAIAAKGPASPGDRKHEMAREALKGLKSET